jgi:predicted RNA-binding Zn ribbon-like protein
MFVQGDPRWAEKKAVTGRSKEAGYQSRLLRVKVGNKALRLQWGNSMKKALPDPNVPFLERNLGERPKPWDFRAEEVVEAVNEGAKLKQEPTKCEPHTVVLLELSEWMRRYLEEGISDKFLDDLNSDLNQVRYAKYVVPLDLLPSESGFPRDMYMAEFGHNPTPEAIAANDFSRLLTSGELKRLKRCQQSDCQNFFLGPPQAKWCSKTCGSKHRVRKKRRRDSVR